MVRTAAIVCLLGVSLALCQTWTAVHAADAVAASPTPQATKPDPASKTASRASPAPAAEPVGAPKEAVSTPTTGTTRVSPPIAEPPVKVSGAAVTESKPVLAPLPHEVQPPLYYLPDKQGHLQPVPGFSFEDFMALYKLKAAADPRQIRYTLEELRITGTAQEDRAEVTVRLKLLVEGEQRVRIPLRLNQAILREPMKHEGPGKHYLAFDEEADGYTCWIEGPAGEHTHQLTGSFLVPLDQTGIGQRLRLLLPRATDSEFKLQVPLAKATARVSEGSMLMTPKAVNKNATELTAKNVGGEWELAWWPSGGKTAESSVELEAVGQVLVRLDGRERVTEATLSVRSYGKAFERFRVRLPRNAELVSGESASYTIVPVEPKQAGAAADRLVEVQLAKRGVGPAEVQLSTRQPCDLVKAPEWLELGGFEVVGAVRQRGHMAVAVAGDWHVLWGPSRGVRRVDQWPEALRFEDVAAGFEYFTQPYSVAMRLAPRKTHAFVEPEYLLFVDPDQVRLEAKLKYTIRGAKVFALDVKLGDWLFDQVEPEHLVAVDALQFNPSQTLTIPLQQPSTGQIELLLRAHQPIAKGSTAVSLNLPQPAADSQGSAVVVVLPADNVELTPDSQSSVNLSREQPVARLQFPERQQEPLFYRAEGGKGGFAAQFAIRPRRVDVESAAQVTMDGKLLQAEQKLRYLVAYEPLDRLTLELPRGLVGSEGFTMQWKGHTLRPVILPDREEGERSPSPSATLHIAAVLPKAHIGSGELVLRYSLPMSELPLGQDSQMCVLLALPSETRLAAHRVAISAPPGCTLLPPIDPWTASDEETAPLALPRAVRWESAVPASQVTFGVRRGSKDSTGGTVIERAWVQTWLTQSARQDRAVYRFSTEEREIQLTLPEGAAVGQLLLLLDGKAAIPQAIGQGTMLISLGPADGPQQHVLELRYHFPEGRPARGLVKLVFPRLGREAWIRRLYWQLVLPRNEHLLWSPEGFTREYSWGWSDYFWGRRPTLSQSQLETWVGATRQTSAPEDTNRYLFSAMGRTEGCELGTAGRPWIVLFASGGALVVGLLLIHVPSVRHPASLLVAAVGLLFAGALFPEVTLLACQAASLGMVLALLAGVLQRMLARRRRTLAYPEAVQILEKKSTEVLPHPVGPAAPKSTQDAPAAPPPATLEWNP